MIPPTLRQATDALLALALDDAPLPLDPTDETTLATLKEAAGIQGIGPWLGVRLVAGEIDAPEPLAGWLREQLRRNQLRQARMRDELLLLLATLARAGIDAVPLKGAALLAGDPGAIPWRTLSDLDLLVTGDHGQVLDLALAHAGYCLRGAHWKHRHYASCAPGPPLVTDDGEHPDNPRDVEVHASVGERFRGFRWEITSWFLARTARDAAIGTRLPDDDALAVHAAIHASVALLEGSGRAVQLLDVARALDRSGPEPLLAVARDAGIAAHARFLYPAAAFSARLLASEPATVAARQLAPHVTAAMRRWAAAASLYDVSWAGRHERGTLASQQLWARTPAERARMSAATLLPPPAVIASADGGLDPRALLTGYVKHYRGLVTRVPR